MDDKIPPRKIIAVRTVQVDEEIWMDAGSEVTLTHVPASTCLENPQYCTALIRGNAYQVPSTHLLGLPFKKSLWKVTHVNETSVQIVCLNEHSIRSVKPECFKDDCANVIVERMNPQRIKRYVYLEIEGSIFYLPAPGGRNIEFLEQ